MKYKKSELYKLEGPELMYLMENIRNMYKAIDNIRNCYCVIKRRWPFKLMGICYSVYYNICYKMEKNKNKSIDIVWVDYRDEYSFAQGERNKAVQKFEKIKAQGVYEIAQIILPESFRCYSEVCALIQAMNNNCVYSISQAIAAIKVDRYHKKCWKNKDGRMNNWLKWHDKRSNIYMKQSVITERWSERQEMRHMQQNVLQRQRRNGRE